MEDSWPRIWLPWSTWESQDPEAPYRRKMTLVHHSRNVDPEFPHFTPKESPDYKTKCWWHWLINPPKCPKGRARVPVQSKKARFSFSCLHNPALLFFTAFATIWNGSEAPSSHLTVPVFYISSFWNFPLLLIFLWGHHFPPLWVHMTWLALTVAPAPGIDMLTRPTRVSLLHPAGHSDCFERDPIQTKGNWDQFKSMGLSRKESILFPVGFKTDRV